MWKSVIESAIVCLATAGLAHIEGFDLQIDLFARLSGTVAQTASGCKSLDLL